MSLWTLNLSPVDVNIDTIQLLIIFQMHMHLTIIILIAKKICSFLKCFRGRQSGAKMSLIILKKSASSTRYIFLYSLFWIFFYLPHNRQLSKHVSSCTPFGQTSYHHLTWFFSLQLTIINQCLRMGVTFAQTRGSAISIYIINNKIFFHYFWMMIIFSPGFFAFE